MPAAAQAIASDKPERLPPAMTISARISPPVLLRFAISPRVKRPHSEDKSRENGRLFRLHLDAPSDALAVRMRIEERPAPRRGRAPAAPPQPVIDGARF